MSPKSKAHEDNTEEWHERPDAFRGDNPGGPLFVTDRAKASAKRACLAIINSPFGVEIPIEKRRAYKQRLEGIANTFLAARDYDQRMSLSEIKAAIRGVRGDLRSLLAKLDELPEDALVALNERWLWNKREQAREDNMNRIRVMLAELERSADGIIEANYKKGASTAVRRCCIALWKLREEITGLAFRRNFQAAKGDAADEFVSPDARFVQLIISAFDSTVSFQTIRTQLMAVARERSRPSTKS